MTPYKHTTQGVNLKLNKSKNKILFVNVVVGAWDYSSGRMALAEQTSVGVCVASEVSM